MFIEPIQMMRMTGFGEENSLTEKAAGLPFANVLKDAITTMQETQQAADKDAVNLANGNVDDLAAIMVNSAKQATAIEMTVQLSTRIVNAYKEVMQMQI